MYRYAIEELKKWMDRKSRKPMILEGARQVGKTWLMKEFGATEFEDVAYINFDSNTQMRELFAGDLGVERIITGLELYVGKKINAEKTLLMRCRKFRARFPRSNIFVRTLRSITSFAQDPCSVSRCMRGHRFPSGKWSS